MINLISSGSMADENGNSHNYNILEGVDLVKTLDIQKKWIYEFAMRFINLQTDNPGISDFDLMQKYNLQDSHWNWVGKAMQLNNPDYLWFSLESNGQVEAIIVVYHPQKSRIISDDIYYIDYLAVAPWNRVVGNASRKFKGLGPTLIKEAGKYIGVNLSYGYSFSLHSLPQASGFYTRIGMTDFGPDVSKDNMHYFEIQEQIAKDFVYGI